MKCPVCAESNLVMSERQGVEIDYCPSCRGIWLDRGELDKIIDKVIASERPQTTVPPQHHKEYKGDDYPKYKKKHWLNDLFD